ncbi:outer membrane protein assembly factor BamB family protein [Thalassoroseus pseudoceratinae]|uniref:outer membrane protein assembly factor BamB family protein n=1 Tax=Thalassoroseus pseudoceratinae TaxID=2713176 RepID=UPI0014230039|nr:PQQ-binding-like beta-propeller repeat protein [Thalassoroseus pseudoceratinae]
MKWIFLGIGGLLIFTCELVAEDWPHWRGPNRNDIIDEPSGWDGNHWLSKKPAWSINVGEGASSPLVVGNDVFVMGWKRGQDVLTCRDANTGKERWSVNYDCPRFGRLATGDQGLYSGPTATPEYDPQTGLLYTLSCDGDLNCWNTRQQGKNVWHLNLYDRFQVGRRPKIGRSGRRDYGYTTAPLVHQDWVIIEVGSEDGLVMAFQKSTGKQVWTSDANGPAGHTGGPVPITVQNIPCIAVLSCYHLYIIRIDSKSPGETIAQYEWTTNFINNIATPAVHKNYVLITSAYNHESICKLKITLDGAEKIWQAPFSSKVCSPIIHDGHIYWAWRELHCLDFETGKPKWKGGRFGDAGSCILTNDDRLIVWGGRGQLSLVESAKRADSYQELARRDRLGSGDVWPHVVLANHRIYTKDRKGQLTCLAIR